MKVIYVAGPFRAKNAWEIECNVRRAEDAAALLVMEFGLMPLIPHANTRFFHGMGSDDSFWLEGTLEMMRRCDAVYMLDGWEASSGSCGEKAEAERLGIRVFTSSDHEDIRLWAISKL